MSPGSEWFEFDAPLEAMPWGRNVYVIIRLEPGLADAATSAATRRVDGNLDQVAVNLGINRADVLPDPFVYAGRGLRKRLDANAGDLVRCRLRPAAPDHVPVDDDIHRALAAAGRLHAFDRRTPAEKRRLLQPIDHVTRPATRERRIAALVQTLPPD